MAETETRPGFKLPWAGDKTEPDRADNDATTPSAASEAPTTTEEPVTTDMIETTTPVAARRPTKLMADLSRAMQNAAEGSRDETMTRFLADSKTVVEEIQAASTVEAADLRRHADDDVATVREWSKTEIARIREETEARIAARKTALDGEIDAHALVVEARVQRVNATIESFQAEMDEFFERLLAEGDPTRIATMAETMPEPPDLAGIAATIATPGPEPFDPLQTRLASVMGDRPPEAVPSSEAPPAGDDMTAEAEAALAARLDFAAAEAEALAFTGDDEDGPSSPAAPAETATPAAPLIPALAQADAGELPAHTSSERTTTRVVVVGLVSVASIATFKRGLGRTAGVSSVGVASGPDGEFVFTVEHDSALRMGEAVTSLSGFEARITGESTGTLEVAAHDPDTGA